LIPGSAASPSQANCAVDWLDQLDRHARWLRTVILARCGEAQAVDEVFQEVAAAAVRQQAPLKDATKAGAWLYQLAVRQSLMYRRKVGRRRRLHKNYAERSEPLINERQAIDPLHWLLSEEQRTHIRIALNRLPKRESEMLLLKYTEDWSYQQIAEHLGMSHSAVESRLHRARQRFRRELMKLNVIETRT
jgi:RNA polymerase sigma-70 factor (ECF subfamily)